MANDNNKSDYNKPFMDLRKFLPEPYQSDVNISLFNNLFNRFLTKQDIDKISGYIGRGNKNAIISRQIKEPTVHRQAFQLQPILYDKIGSVEHMASWKDIQSELARLGVEIGNQARWGAVQKFNWVPPIDINKLVNYRDYYWKGDYPEYITIRSRCSVSTARLTFWDGLITQYGSTFPVEDILPIDNLGDLPTFNIININSVTGRVDISGDAREYISNGDFLDIQSNPTFNGTYQATSILTYDGITNTTYFTVSGLPSAPNLTQGAVVLRRFDKIVLGANDKVPTGDYTRLFEEGMIVFLRNFGTNLELNNTFIKVVKSEADEDNKQTIVTIQSSVTDNRFIVASGSPFFGSEASLEEERAVFEADKKCQCDELGGWDDSLWDDNPFTPLWGDSETWVGCSMTPTPDGISDHRGFLDCITNPGPPPGAGGTQDQLWYDEGSNNLYQYDTTLGWKLIWNNFSLILDATKGFALWDFTLQCDTRPRIEASDQWSKTNYWYHKNDITSFGGFQRATQPIIEYDWDLELNEWIYTNYNWGYRRNVDADFAPSDTIPPSIELDPITWWENDTDDKIVILDSRYGDQTDYFTPGRLVRISDGTLSKTVKVDFSEYKSVGGLEYRTYITMTTSAAGGSLASLDNLIPNTFKISPFATLNGDIWLGYGVHWLFLGADDPVPVPHQVENPYVEIDTSAPITEKYVGSPPALLYEYTTSAYAQNYLLAMDYDEFILSDDINQLVTGDTRSLRRKALVGFDDVRVYVSDLTGENRIRQTGTYDEIGEAVIKVTSIDAANNKITIGGNANYSLYFNPTDEIKLRDNTGVGEATFTVSSVAGSVITVAGGSPLPLANVTVSGEISNVTNPLPGDEFVNDAFTTIYAIGVRFFTPVPAGLNVTIEVGASSIEEIGHGYNFVRMLENNDQYNINGDKATSRLRYHKIDQVKTKPNQYPLFDIFKVDGTPAFKANPIFGYRTSPDAPINRTGLRIVYDSVNDVYEFDQFLLDEDNGTLYAYRDYSNKQEDIWYNPENKTVYFWENITWSDKTIMGDQYRRAIVDSVEPSDKFDGLYWYNTSIDVLYRYFGGNPIEVSPIDKYLTDINLQTIWKAGLNNEEYVPEQVDWERRSLTEYLSEEIEYVQNRIPDLLIEDPSLSETQAAAIALIEWYNRESNHLSEDGRWVGDWEIPDPLYYNNLQENKKYLNSRELLTHFTTIINMQPPIPGYSGSASGMFNLIPSDKVNYGYGGTIKEFNDGFDILLSSTFVNNVTPRSLIEFAHDQYESLLNNLKEIYRKNSLTMFSNLEIENILDMSSYISNEVIKQYELNDQAAFVYGDSTTFTDVDGVNDKGVRNWIATLPYVNLVRKHLPERLFDEQLNVDEIVHHDGHRNIYALTGATADIISQLLIMKEDPRIPPETIGVSGSILPPNNVTEFNSVFGSTISNREGVYYYQVTNNDNTLYRYIVAESGPNQPSNTYPDGTLWMDLTPGAEVLRIKSTDFLANVTWDIVDGLSLGDARLHNGTDPTDLNTATVSAWQEINLDLLLGDIIFEVENRLYENVPDFPLVAYDFEKLANENPGEYKQYLEDAFLDYVSQNEISTPFLNTDFSATDPYTWNYYRSAQGGPLPIIEAGAITNSFVVSGDRTATFTPDFTFYVKNSGENDGTWKTLSTAPVSIYDPVDDTTRIYVTGDVKYSNVGILYAGRLPSDKNLLSSVPIPNNLNDGSESGGDWRDLYTKVYGTPYPHKEPWVLQGYADKPQWWDEEYLNDNIDQWGDRVWKYKHGFEITTAVNNPLGYLTITGDFHDVFISNEVLSINNDNSLNVDLRETITNVTPGVLGAGSIEINAPATPIYQPGTKISIVTGTQPYKTYTVKNAIVAGATLIITLEETVLATDISVGDSINGAIYDPVTNTTTIKADGVVNTTSPLGRITKTYGMWENIKRGNIPAGREYPNGVASVYGVPTSDRVLGISAPDLPVFIYFSVNIGNFDITADITYSPDGVFPPYVNYLGAGFDEIIRSLYSDFSTEIVAPNANYNFADAGPVEWRWRTSSQFLYDQLTVAYRIDPVRYVSSTFGFDYTVIAGLQVDRFTENTPSHTRINFHGEVVGDQPVRVDGLNQWYVNFNRYAGFDASFSDFRELWTGWTAPMMYQFSSYIDTPSLSVGHRYISVSNFDYNITSKRAPGVEDFWIDAFKIKILNIPPNVAKFNNQIDWRFELNTNINISRNIKYYDVRNYQFRADPVTNECSLYTWEISSLDSFNKTFSIEGDQTYVFKSGSNFNIIGSSGNDGYYTVVISTYDTITGFTTIVVEENILSAAVDGVLKADYRTIPWETGDGVYFSTNKILPIPLLSDTINGLTKYFIIKVDDTTFKIAETPLDATTNTPIDITSSGTGDQFVGEILSVFEANNGVRTNTKWRYYALDKTNVLEFNTPHEVQGMQTLVDIVNGYDHYSNDNGWKVNGSKSEIDPVTGQIISWKSETERFITYAYSQRIRREQVNNRYPVTVDAGTDEWTFIDDNKTFITGDTVILLSSNNVYPTPLSRGIRYYVIRTTVNTFKLAATNQDAINGIAIDIISTAGVGDLSVLKPNNFKTLVPDFEMNPFRNAIWIQPDRGIISNIITGPVEDIRTTQLIFNQNGDRINSDQLRVYRQDKETKISVIDAIDQDKLPLVNTEYAALNLGGLHLFIDAYEHVMKFNNYTAEGNLIYDPFIGLNVTKFEMLFNRQPEFTQRPNVGGYYLETFFNQGANMKENFESSVENLRYAYDTYDVLESNNLVKEGRSSLGYLGTRDYLSNLNLSEKSQFLFWRGQIQAKGSVNAVKAFINSRRFIDAKVDDFWAIKLGNFGSTGEKEFPEMFVTTVDSRSNELRLEFVTNDDPLTSIDETFTPIKMSDQDRWYNQPDQVSVLRDNGKVMYFDMKIRNKMVAVIKTGSPTDIIVNNGKSYIKHDLDADTVEITQYDPVLMETYTLVEGTHYEIVNNNIIEFISGYGSPALDDDITIWGMVFKDDAQNPARIIDRESETQITPIQYWNPARNKHYSLAIHNVDLQNANDPAVYSNTPKTTNENVWSTEFVGTTWMNLENLDFVSYNSELMLTDQTERFRSWGQLADWSEYELYEWVESDIPPSEWDATASVEEGDLTIPESIRKSGIARKVLFEKDTGGNWIPATNKVDEQYASIDSVLSTASLFIFAVDLTKFVAVGSPLSYFVNVYINGKLYEENADVTSGFYSVNTPDIKNADIIRFMQLLPTDQTVIDEEVAAGTLLQEYEYTQVPFYDELGNINYKYYFWVRRKTTLAPDKNRTMSMREAETQLATMPAAHMFFQNPVSSETIAQVDSIEVQRRESHVVSGSPNNIFYFELTPVLTKPVVIEVDGVDLLSTDFVISGSPLSVTILNPTLVGGEKVTINYTGLKEDTITLPYRFTQAIIRGLQGIVTADNRYTVRFTRNFTLRDTLDINDLNVGPLDLKNLHEEWKIFRKEQQFHIDRWQWDKITESIVGYKLDDPTVRVPSYERELYDEKYKTDTQYGLGDNQAFVNGSLALRSIISYLIDPDIDFTPVDINLFFETNSFDTPENIISAMNNIYNNFSFSNVNRMYFSVLKDAFTTKAKYSEIFKTSMISLHGIRPFQTSGIFDD